jgi:hypothetical protein
VAYPDLEEVRKQYSALRELVIHNPGGWDDVATRERIHYLVERAIDALDDAECTQQLRRVQTHAAELYSAEEHAKWQRKSMSGADYLRLQILIALEVVNTRLFMIDALRNRVATAGPRELPAA